MAPFVADPRAVSIKGVRQKGSVSPKCSIQSLYSSAFRAQASPLAGRMRLPGTVAVVTSACA